jgi:hypothetical protein
LSIKTQAKEGQRHKHGKVNMLKKEKKNYVLCVKNGRRKFSFLRLLTMNEIICERENV